MSQIIRAYAYELELPQDIKLHPVFHVSLLYPAPNNPVAGQHIPPPPTVIVDDNEEFQMEEILDRKLYSGKPSYYVQGTGYNNPAWEPAGHHTNSAAIKSFHQRYPAKPEPWDT